MKPTPGSEGELLTRVMEALTLLPGCRPMRRNSGRRGGVNMCEEGTPDIAVMLRGGRITWLELKTADGVVNAAQIRWHERALEMGHTVYVVRSVAAAVAAVRAEVAR